MIQVLIQSWHAPLLWHSVVARPAWCCYSIIYSPDSRLYFILYVHVSNIIADHTRSSQRHESSSFPMFDMIILSGPLISSRLRIELTDDVPAHTCCFHCPFYNLAEIGSTLQISLTFEIWAHVEFHLRHLLRKITSYSRPWSCRELPIGWLRCHGSFRHSKRCLEALAPFLLCQSP